MLTILCWTIAGLIGAGEPSAESRAGMEGLQRVQELVGQWEGSGKSDKSGGWDEKIDCRWQFDPKGRGSLRLAFEPAADEQSSGLLADATLTYDAAKDAYTLQARAAGGKEGRAMTFVGKARTSANLILTRTAKGAAKDDLDRIDLKILNDGDRLVYLFQRRLGQGDRFRPIAQVGLNRVGTSLAAAGASGPKCIVTGGAGTMPVSYEGKAYYVCCTGCKEAFLADPKAFIAKAEKK